MTRRLENKVALVTGGGAGLGEATAKRFAEEGAHVWVTDLNEDSASAVVAAIEANGGSATARYQDVTVEDDWDALMDEIVQASGKLDVIVNNAGLVRSTPKEEFNPEDHRAILDLNLLAPAALLSAALPHLKRGASIVSISSVNAELPPRDAVTYGASKAALNLWTKAMAKELGPDGIRVNAVAPGAINIPEDPRSDELTQLFVDDTALGRIGTPEDIAKAVRFLVSDASEFVTGEVLTVSGGYRL